jgi:hypothetical protein
MGQVVISRHGGHNVAQDKIRGTTDGWINAYGSWVLSFGFGSKAQAGGGGAPSVDYIILTPLA